MGWDGTDGLLPPIPPPLPGATRQAALFFRLPADEVCLFAVATYIHTSHTHACMHTCVHHMHAARKQLGFMGFSLSSFLLRWLAVPTRRFDRVVPRETGVQYSSCSTGRVLFFDFAIWLPDMGRWGGLVRYLPFYGGGGVWRVFCGCTETYGTVFL